MILERGFLILDPSEVAATDDFRRRNPTGFLVEVSWRTIALARDAELHDAIRLAKGDRRDP